MSPSSRSKTELMASVPPFPRIPQATAASSQRRRLSALKAGPMASRTPTLMCAATIGQALGRRWSR